MSYALQLHNMTRCSIAITVCVAKDSYYVDLIESADQVWDHAHLLRQHQLALGISVAAATETTTHVPLAVLTTLIPFIHSFDTYSIPLEQPSAFTTTKARSQVSGEHIWELCKSDLSVCTFYLSTDNDNVEFIKCSVVKAVASMTNLTKLHITIDNKLPSIDLDFQPLSKLSMIIDLAIQIIDQNPTCCHGVLSSNRQTLQFVTLTASSWTASTYSSLQHVAELKTLNLTITEIDTAQAQALEGITADLFTLTLHGGKSAGAFQAMHDIHLKVHELTLRDANSQSCLSYNVSLSGSVSN